MGTIMEAGRELDFQIAEKVFGQIVRDPHNELDNPEVPIEALKLFITRITVPHYSTDIGAAWQVVEKLNEDDFILEAHGTGWKAHFGAHWRGSESPAHAICLAALEKIEAK